MARRVSWIAIVALLVCSPVWASLITNGSFETPGGTSTFTTLNAGNTTLTGWTIAAGSVDYIHTYWQAQNGTSSLDMQGNSPGTISQTVSGLTPGKTYVLSFWMSGNPDGLPQTKVLEVTAGGVTQDFSYVMGPGNTKTHMLWAQQILIFAATSSSTVIQFKDLSGAPGYYGAALDDVNLDPVPEPVTLVLLGPATLVLIGLKRRRRDSHTET